MSTNFELAHAKTALLVIDLQNFFMAEGMPAEIPSARDIVGRVNTLAAAARAHGAPVIWMKMTFGPHDTGWTAFDRMRTDRQNEARKTMLRAGHPGHDIYPELEVHASDLVLEKTRFSAFTRGSSSLEDVLVSRGIDTIIVTGTATNQCCEATARDAMMLNYRVVFVADATAAMDDASHLATLANVEKFVGDVVDTRDVVRALEASTQRAPGEP